MKEEIRLTQYSHGSGCGCKIAPAVLEEILSGGIVLPADEKLLVGNDSRDDAAVYDLGNGTALIATTDFFTPIVDDPFFFGRIAAANAISDVYAMGGKPVLALAILGWPVDKLSPVLAQKVIDGAKSVCAECGITISGGHSIDIPEPVFGLSVNGFVLIDHLKRNNTAEAGDIIFMSKKIGTGIITTAGKRGLAHAEDLQSAIAQMCEVNRSGEKVGMHQSVHAVTDITGFGLLGHLLEMAKGSNLSVELNYNNIPLLQGVREYAAKFIYPDNTMRNWNAFQLDTEGINGESLLTLCDPQTNGGLLVAVKENLADVFAHEFPSFHRIGNFTEKKEKVVKVNY